MGYEYIVRLLGKDIISILYFLPVIPQYLDNNLVVEAKLNEPVTKEVIKLVKNNFTFGLEYYFSIIINNEKTANKVIHKRLTYKTGWTVNDSTVNENRIQEKMGNNTVVFKNISFKEGDTLLLFIRVRILPDTMFSKSTGLKTSILWNYYTPKIKRVYTFKGSEFIPHEN